MLKILPPRIIPTLLLRNRSFVKGMKFKNHQYVGDPLNIIKLFNDLQASEILIMGIDARENNGPDFEYLDKISSQAFMPLSYGGGIKDLSEASKIISCGFEKVILNSTTLENPELISLVSSKLGSSSTVGCIDVRKNKFLSGYKVFTNNARKKEKIFVQDLATMYQELGAGELIINSVDLDGSGKGYDLALIESLIKNVDIPLIVSCGANNISDFKKAIDAGASGVSAGDFFIYKGEHRAVLVSYPDYESTYKLFSRE